MFYLGVFQALALTFLISFYNVFLRISVQEWQINPVAFTCYCLMMAAFVLSMAAGPGKLVKETFKSPFTWIYSIILISTYIVDTYVMHYISGTEASFFSRMTIPIALAIAWVFFNRKPKKSDLVGVGVIIVGLIWLIQIQPSETLRIILITVSLSALFQTLQFVLAETHKEASQANKSGTIRDEWRVTGLVTFVSSFIFLLITLGASVLEQRFNLGLSFAPELSAFIDKNTVYAALFYGLLILPFIRYFKWSASQNLKAENLLLFMAFIPVLTLAFEYIASFIVAMPSSISIFEGDRGITLLTIAVLMTFGAGLTTFLRIKNEIAKNTGKGVLQGIKEALTRNGDMSIHHSATARDDYEVICSTLEITSHDKEKAAKLLDIPESTLTVIYNGKGKLALESEYSTRLMRKYRKEVANKDALTGILNRSGFMSQFKQEIDQVKHASVLFIDLNKFKPVNDTYGHDAGDFILQGVADRLSGLYPKRTLVTRLGGDEFAILLLDKTKEQATEEIAKIKTQLAEPFSFNGVEITIGGSVGIATYPEDGSDPEKLLKLADEGMYREKDTR